MAPSFVVLFAVVPLAGAWIVGVARMLATPLTPASESDEGRDEQV